MRRKTITLFVTMAIITALLLPCIALAYIYEAPLTVAEISGGPSFDMLPVFTASNNQWLIDNGFIRADAQDTSVETLAGSVKPRMLTDDKTFTAIPVPANSQTNLKFKTGQSNTNMQIIVGNDGYISGADSPTSEPGSDFGFEIDAYVDTSVGADKNLIYKEHTFRVYVSASTNITAFNITGGWTTPTGHVANAWVNPGNAWDDNVVTRAHFNTAAGAWSNFLELTHAAINISEVRYFCGGSLAGFTSIDVDVFHTAAWHDVYEGVFVYDVWETKAVVANAVTSMRIRLWNNAVPAKDAYIYEADYFDSAGVGVTATGVVSGEHTVTIEGNALLWAPGDALNFDGTATSNVNCGVLHNASAKLWVSFWFKPDALFEAGVVTQYLWAKRIGGNDQLAIFLDGASGSLTAIKNVGGPVAFQLSSVQTSWTADTWYHVIASISNVNAARFIIDGGAALTDPDVTAAPNPGDFIIGDRSDPGVGIGFEGEIANFVCGTDDLLVAEEAALYAGTAPGDEVNFWYIDEGTGVTIIDYGTGGNNGTADLAPVWETTNRLCTFAISLDGTAEDGFARPISVVDNANNWIINQNNVLPYMAYYKQSVGGVLIVHYEPDTLIIGTTLPDLETAVVQDGTMTWGANPGNITVTLGSMLSAGQPDIGSGAETPSRDVLPDIQVSDWYVEPDVTGSLLTNPIRPFVTLVSDNTTLTELQTWRWLGIAFVLLITGACIRSVPRHLVIACIGAGVATVAMVVLTIFPQWVLVFLILYALGGWVSERSPSL